MRSRNRYDGIDPTIIRSVQAQARRLSRGNALPGMDIEDIEQELMLHVLRRVSDFDVARASFPTFIDRVVRNRAVTLTEAARTQKRGVGTEIVLFSDLETDSAPTGEPPADWIVARQGWWGRYEPPPEDAAMLRHDVSRLMGALPTGLRQCCRWLHEGSVGNAYRDAGLARSTAYERLADLRSRCRSADLEIYLGRTRTLSMSSR